MILDFVCLIFRADNMKTDLIQPSIEVWGIQIAEPITSITDVLIAVVCIWAYYKIKKTGSKKKEIQYLKIFFVSMSFATAFGGIIGHAFLHYLSFGWKLPAWLTSMISVAFLERSAIQYARNYIPKKLGTFFAYLNIIELITFIIITFSLLEFRWVEYHSAYGILFIVGGFSAYMFYSHRSKASLLFLIGVFFCVISAVVFTQGWGIDKWFNHMDVSHILMCVGAWAFCKGGLEMVKE